MFIMIPNSGQINRHSMDFIVSKRQQAL